MQAEAIEEPSKEAADDAKSESRLGPGKALGPPKRAGVRSRGKSLIGGEEARHPWEGGKRIGRR